MWQRCPKAANAPVQPNLGMRIGKIQIFSVIFQCSWEKHQENQGVFHPALFHYPHSFSLTPGKVLQVLWQLGDRTVDSKKCTVTSLSTWRGCLPICVLELQQRLERGPSLCSLVAQMPNATGALVHCCGFYLWSLPPEQAVEVRQSLLIEQGQDVCLRPTCQYHHRNAPVGYMSELWRDPHGLYFTHWSVNYIIELPLLPAPLPKILARGYPLMHFFTVVKLHCHFSGWISSY